MEIHGWLLESIINMGVGVICRHLPIWLGCCTLIVLWQSLIFFIAESALVVNVGAPKYRIPSIRTIHLKLLRTTIQGFAGPLLSISILVIAVQEDFIF